MRCGLMPMAETIPESCIRILFPRSNRSVTALPVFPTWKTKKRYGKSYSLFRRISVTDFGCITSPPVPLKTQLPSEIAAAAFRSFKERYPWNTKVRAVTVRAIELSPKDSVEQLTLFDNVQHRMAMEEVQDAVEEIRDRFGKSAISYACLMGDLKMSTDGRDKVKMPGLMYQ